MPNIDTRLIALKESLNPGAQTVLPSSGVPGDRKSLTSWTEIRIFPEGAARGDGRVVDGSGSASGKTWVLPLPQDLSEPHSLQYEPIEFGALARVTASVLNKFGSTAEAQEKGITSDPIGAAEAFKQVGYVVGEEILGFFGLEQMINFARARGRNTTNPNMENMFKTANIRTFQFSWNLTPLSASDAKSIKEFLNTMRLEIYPKNQEVGLGFNRLKFPSEFEISFHSVGYNGGQNTILKTAPCVCTDFTVQHTPNGAYNTHIDGEPTSISINGTFQEMYALHRGDMSGLIPKI
jgi:hypothetical protein